VYKQGRRRGSEIGDHPIPFLSLLPLLYLPPLYLSPSFLFPSRGPALEPAKVYGERCKLPQWGLRLGKAAADKRFGAYLSRKEQLWRQLFYVTYGFFLRIGYHYFTAE